MRQETRRPEGCSWDLLDGDKAKELQSQPGLPMQGRTFLPMQGRTGTFLPKICRRIVCLWDSSMDPSILNAQYLPKWSGALGKDPTHGVEVVET